MNEANFKNYDHEHEDTSLINGLSEIDAVPKYEEKGNKQDSKGKMKDIEKKCEELSLSLKALEQKNTLVRTIILKYNRNR